MTEILTTAQMYQAERLAINIGHSGIELMAAAGEAVVELILANYTKQAILILAGPGNNGGDGFVVALRLRQEGWPVRLCFVGQESNLPNDAKHYYDQLGSPLTSIDEIGVPEPLLIDALFGAGLSRPITGELSELVEKVNQSSCDVIAVDFPSGINGDSGQVLGCAFKARHTVTFFKPKLGHLQQPGRSYCGQLTVADIGISRNILSALGPMTRANSPEVWTSFLPRPASKDHKYSRGLSVIYGNITMPGAARLATLAARRVGAGLAKIVTDADQDLSVFHQEMGHLVSNDWSTALADPRNAAFLIGPGAGTHPDLLEKVQAILAEGKPTVIDADAISVFREKPTVLFDAIKSDCVLTPHSGEFRRLFPSIANNETNKIQKSLAAAKLSGAVIVHKGSDTVIASPDGRSIINTNAPPWLATGGTGDVLAGMVAGLLAQGVPTFEAAAMAVWMHGEAANRFGVGLIAEDLPKLLPSVLAELMKTASSGG